MSRHPLITPQSKIYVAGHNGMVGSAIVRHLRRKGFHNVLTRSRHELNLLDQSAVNRFLASETPDFIFLAAAKVGGIQANNTERAAFLYENLTIQTNIIHGAWRAGIHQLLFLGSSCIYPRDCPQPIAEDSLLTGPLEQTNEPYAIAKIAGIKLCESYNHQYGTRFISAMPTNLYGPNDNYDLATSHVLPALIRKAHEAKVNKAEKLILWGSGEPRREFLHVDDVADACLFLMQADHPPDIVNIGVGKDLPIRELAELIKQIVGCSCTITYDLSKPDGTPQKLLDVSRMKNYGWTAKISLEEGLRSTYAAYKALLSKDKV